MTHDEVKALPDGTSILVSWGGRTEPMPYRLHQRGQWGPYPTAVGLDGMLADNISSLDVVTLPE